MMDRLTQWTPEGASLVMADSYESEADARKDLMARFLVAVKKLASFEDKIERGEMVEVVRCRECKKSHTDRWQKWEPSVGAYVYGEDRFCERSEFRGVRVDDSDFCSHGKRKEAT